MIDTTAWVKFRDDPRLSWHVVRPGIAPWIWTRCGRSCETCLRLVAHDAEKATA